MKKKLTYAGLVIGLSVMASMTAFAGEWKQDSKGWTYQNDDGTRYSNGWQWIDGNNDGVSECYYFNDEGYLLTSTTTPDNYTVNADGARVENGVVQRKSNAVFKAAYMSVDYDPAFDGMTYSPGTLTKDDKSTSVIYVVPSTVSEYPKCGVTLSCADRTKINDDTLNSNIKKTLDDMATSVEVNKQYKDFDINGKHWQTVSGNYIEETDGTTGYMISAVTYDANRAYMTTYIADLSLGGVPLTAEQYLSKFHITDENVIWTQANGVIN